MVGETYRGGKAPTIERKEPAGSLVSFYLASEKEWKKPLYKSSMRSPIPRVGYHLPSPLI